MVLVCRGPKPFIYLKTRKTGGTSVEVYFERYALPPEGYEETHYRPLTISEHGVVCRERPASEDGVWRPHMEHGAVRAQVGEAFWSEALKVCVVRNPWNTLVSAFWWATPRELAERLAAGDFARVRGLFNAWIARQPVLSNRAIYAEGGRSLMDVHIRQERMAEGVAEVCARIGAPFEPERLGRYKSEARRRPEPFPLYYDEASLRRVGEACAEEIEQFGYTATGDP